MQADTNTVKRTNCLEKTNPSLRTEMYIILT